MTELGILARAVAAVAAEAGRSALRGIGEHHASRPKGRFDVQLDADVDAENAIVPRLRELVPGSEVCSEEMGGPVDWAKRDVWIVDPLDGTNNYHAAVPYLAISVGFRRERKLVLAVVRDPVLGNSYSARLGCGAEKDGEPLFPGAGKDVSRATVSLITDYSSAGRKAGEILYLKLNSIARRVMTLWAPAADLVRVATGHMDAIVCVRAGYGDVCSGLLILAEAGGVILDPNGKDLDVANLDPGGPVSFIAAASRDTAMKLREEIREEFDCYALCGGFCVEPWKPSIEAVNYHIWRTCNMKCRFCFATYDSILPARARRGISLPGVRELIDALSAAGFAKITFAGGEPTLCPWLADAAGHAKQRGLVTGIVTNGSRLTPDLAEALAPNLDWVTLSIDSASPDVNARTGRAVAGCRPVEVSGLAGVAGEFRRRGVRLKVNTVVTRHNCGERVLDVIARIAPERWKVMRALRIEGENDRDFGDLQVTDRQFARFLAVNRDVPAGTVRVCEDNEDMIASYVMVDPAGRFVDNAAGRYRVSEPILRAGVEAAYRQVTHDPGTFRRRGGRYDW